MKKKLTQILGQKSTIMHFGPKKLLSPADSAWHSFWSHSTHIGGTPCKVSHFIHNLNDMAKIQPLVAPLCGYSDAYILASGTITVAALEAGGGKNDMQVVFWNCAPFTNYISKKKPIHK